MIVIAVLTVAFLPTVALLLGLVAAARSNKYRLVAYWWLKSTALFLIGLPVTAFGLFAVALGIPFRRIEANTSRPFSDPRYTHLGSWVRERLPVLLILWDNAFDGLNGDKRGWFANWCLEHKIPYPSFWARWIWAAWRNPANYWSRNITGCKVAGKQVTVVYGPAEVDEDHPGFHMLDCDGCSVIEWVYPWPFASSRAVYARFGWKIKTNSTDTDSIKGSVYRCSFWKAIS